MEENNRSVNTPNRSVLAVEFLAMKHWFLWIVNQLAFLQPLHGVDYEAITKVIKLMKKC